MNAIVCVDAHWGIGNKGNLLVNIPADKKLFKELTTGKLVIGGRKTMEGLPGGHELGGRTNLVLTHRSDYRFGNALVAHSVDETFEMLQSLKEEKGLEDEDIFIIGGQKIYEQFMPYCQKIYVTKVDYVYDADTFFPNLDMEEDWVMTHDSEEQTYYDLEYYFTIYQKKQ